MTAPPLRDQLQRYYAAKEPPPELLAALVDQAQRPAAPSRRRVLAWAAAILVCATGAWMARPALAPEPAPAVQDFAREVARHYLVCADAQAVSVGDVAAAAEQLSRLDFPLVEPPCLKEGKLQVRGVRHCVLRDRVMAELRLEDAAGNAVLLCMSRLPEEVPEETEVEVDGLRVRIWSRAGILMGLARPA
jgi:hypothetical protein